MTSDYRVEVRLRNNNILQRIERAGFDSVAEFCRAFGLRYGTIINLISIAQPALKADGEYRKIVLDLAGALECDPDDLFTDRQARAALKPKAIRNLSEQEALSLASPDAALLVAPSEDIDHRIDTQRAAQRLLEGDNLTDRQRDIVRRRFGFDGPEETYEQIAAAHGVTRERVRQLEAGALRKLKHPARCGFANGLLIG